MARNDRLAFRNNIARDPVTGRYHVRVVVRGRAIQRGFPTKRSALAALEHYIMAAAGIPDGAAVPRLAEAVEDFVARLRLLNRSESTVGYYRLRFARLVEGLGDVRLDGVDQSDVEGYVRERSAEVGPGTVNKELGSLATLYRHVGIEPRWRLPSLSHHPRSRKVHPPATVARLWRDLDDPARVAVGLCLLAGLRASEAFSAEASWVRVDDGELWVPIRKVGAWNRTALVPTLAAILPSDGPLVRTSEAQVRYTLEEASKRLGVSPTWKGPGAFRHHCATWAVEAGASRDQVREVLSHQAGTVTDRYIHSQAVKVKRTVLEMVERVFLEALEAADS